MSRTLGTVSFLVALLSLAPDLLSQSTTRINTTSKGGEAEGHLFGSFHAVMTPDGRYVTFASAASNLVSGDGNDAIDVFVKDRETGETTRVSVSSTGEEGNEESGLYGVAISADGRYVAFESLATNLVPGEVGGSRDIFLHDRQTGDTMRVSVTSSGEQKPGDSRWPTMTSDGRWIAFESHAPLVPEDSGVIADVYLHDRDTGETVLISARPSGGGNTTSFFPSISADGRYVAFASYSPDLMPGDTPGSCDVVMGSCMDVFVFDRVEGDLVRASESLSGGEGDSHSNFPSISADGRFVAFASQATGLVENDTNGPGAIGQDVFVRDLEAGITSRVSLDSLGNEGNGASSDLPIGLLGQAGSLALSPDGRFVTFRSDASNLVPGDANAIPDIFLHDLQSGITIRVSVDSSGDEQQNMGCESSLLTVSADGRLISFQSNSDTLVPGDTNGGLMGSDIFLRDRGACSDPTEGTVNTGAGPATSVLSVNGQTGVVRMPVTTSIEIAMSAAPLGPQPARYALWIWVGPPSNPRDLKARGETLGCTVDPTPLRLDAEPQPFRCLRGDGIPVLVSRGVTELPSPPDAPFSVVKGQGLANPMVFSLQGILEDDGAGNGLGFSVTNAVILVIEEG